MANLVRVESVDVIRAEDLAERRYRSLYDGTAYTFNQYTALIAEMKVSLGIILRHNATRLGKTALVIGVAYSKQNKYHDALHYLNWAIDFFNSQLKVSGSWVELEIEGAPASLDMDFIRNNLSDAYYLSSVVLENMGCFAQAAVNFSKTFQFSLLIPPNRTVNAFNYSVEGFNCSRLALSAVKNFELEKAYDFARRSYDAFIAYQPAGSLENRLQLGKCERVLSLIHSLKDNEETALYWRDRSDVIAVDADRPPVWLDVEFVEIEILLSRYSYAAAQTILDRLSAFDLRMQLHPRVETRYWQCLLDYHQPHNGRLNNSINNLRMLMAQQNVAESCALRDRTMFKVAYEFAVLLWRCERYEEAGQLVHELLHQMSYIPDGSELAIRGYLLMLRAKILISTNNPVQAYILESLTNAGNILREVFGGQHYAIFQLHLSFAVAHSAFGDPQSALQSMNQARDILLMLSFGAHSYTSLMFNINLVDAYRAMHRLNEALDIASGIVQTLHHFDIAPHMPFNHDSKCQYAELARGAQQTLSDAADEHVNNLEELLEL